METSRIKLLGYGTEFIVPIRAYLHEFGSEIYRDGEANAHFMNTLAKNPDKFKKFDYAILVLWGDIDKKERVIDAFGFSGINRWPGNPDVSALVFRNGLYSQSENITCGDTLILLGKEEAYRRKTKSLDDYFRNHLDINLNTQA